MFSVTDTDKLIKDIKAEIEWLSTTDEDEVECISIESLEGILSRNFNVVIKISEE